MQLGYLPAVCATNSSWHGTHTAGTIGAASNNGVGVAGVNWNSKILPVRVLGKCGGYTSDIADGMRWAAGLSVSGVPANANPAKVLNLSLGGSGACDATYQDAVNAITAAGTTIVVSAGNSNADAINYRPGNCNGVITVAATNRDGGRAYYSNYGSIIEISAPGGETNVSNSNGVLSTLNTGTQGPGADTYVYYQGTSMAAPHVAGVASLLYSLQTVADTGRGADDFAEHRHQLPGRQLLQYLHLRQRHRECGSCRGSSLKSCADHHRAQSPLSDTGRSRLHADRQWHGLCQQFSGAMERFEPTDDVCQQHTTDRSNHCRRHCHARHSECYRAEPGAWWRHIECGVIRRGQPCADHYWSQSVLGHTGRSRLHAHRQWHGVCQRLGGALERLEPSDDVCQQHTTDSCNHCGGHRRGRHSKCYRTEPCAWWRPIECDVIPRGYTEESLFASCRQRASSAPVLNAIDNADGDGNYTVSWNAVAGATSYTLEEDDNATFTSPTTQYNAAGTSWNAAGKAAATYYYRVKASNSYGSSGWSNVQSTTVHPLCARTRSRTRILRAVRPTGRSSQHHGWDD